MPNVHADGALPAFDFIVRGSTTYEHLFGFTVSGHSVLNQVGPFADPDDIIDFIRTTFENHPDVYDVSVEKTEVVRTTV